MARKVGDGWPRGLPFITRPEPERPVVTLFRATALRHQATAPACLAEATPAASARIAPSRVVPPLRGNAGRARTPTPAALRVFSARSPIRPDRRLSAPIAWRRSSLPTPIIGLTKQLMPAHFIARLFVPHDLNRRRSNPIGKTFPLRSIGNSTGTKVNGACPRIQPRLYRSYPEPRPPGHPAHDIIPRAGPRSRHASSHGASAARARGRNRVTKCRSASDLASITKNRGPARAAPFKKTGADWYGCVRVRASPARQRQSSRR